VRAKLKELESKLDYQKGDIVIRNGLATLKVPDNFRYLSAKDAQTVLTKMWGNPEGEGTLGMILPADVSPLSSDCWAVVITYTEDGYVKDADADKINYNDLLKEMQAATKEYSAERKKEGYSEIELVGWAAPPRYDKATHKMYWAKEIRFSDSKESTLNYNIRVLGRRGVLVLNAVASMSDFAMIEKHAPDVVAMVDFKEGNRYADFDGKTDKVAAYGLAALVAGGIAAKAGFFKVLWVGLLAAKKLIIVGAVALFGFIKKIFGRKESA
jgi:uncharacterized membrane-anchored protein